MPKRRKGEGSAAIEMESAGMMRWLLTYADMITLLLAMFIILYALASTKSTAVMQEMMAQFRAVFGAIPGNTAILPSQSSNPGEHYKVIPGEPLEGGPGGPKQPTPVHGSGGEISGAVSQALQKPLGANKVSIRKEARGLVISLLTDKVLFDLGDTKVKKEMREVLDQISVILKKYPDKQIVVEGHTDDLAINTSRFASNWELSTLRATSVVEYLVEQKGLDPSRFSASGYGEYQPLVPNISEANRRLNRRVDIVIMKLD
jgi:chemotaxis protein MotB